MGATTAPTTAVPGDRAAISDQKLSLPGREPAETRHPLSRALARSRRLKVPSCWSRSKPAIRVTWVWTRRVWVCRVRVCRGRIGRTGNGTADDGTRRDPGGDAAPTSPIISASVATAADVDVAVDVDVADVAAVDVGAVEVAAVDVGAVEVASVHIGATEVASVCTGATEVASAGTGPGTAAATAAITAAATAAITAATTGASTAAASAPPLAHKGQRHACPLRRGGGDIATYAAAPRSRSGGRLGSHQPDHDDRRHVKQTLRHCCGLTRCIGSNCCPARDCLGRVSGFVDTWQEHYREYTRRPEQRETIERDPPTHLCQ